MKKNKRLRNITIKILMIWKKSYNNAINRSEIYISKLRILKLLNKYKIKI